MADQQPTAVTGMAADPAPGPAADGVSLRRPLCRDCGGRMDVQLMKEAVPVHPTCDVLGPQKRWWARVGRTDPMPTRALALAGAWWLEVQT